MDRRTFDVRPLNSPDDEGAYWRSRSPAERMRALEYLRWRAYGDAVHARIQRVFSVVKLGED